jgi:hypothetical protein
MSLVTLLLRFGTAALTSRVAEKAVEQLAAVITARRSEPPPTLNPDDTLQAQIVSLRETIQRQDQRLSMLDSAIAGFGDALRPLMLRSAVTFWMALASAIISLVALAIAVLA